MSNNENRPKKKKNVVVIIIIIVAVCIIAFAAYNLIKINSEYKEAADTYSGIESLFNTDQDETETTDNAAEKITKKSDKTFTYDYAKLLKVNPASLGWIYCNGWLSYPIVQGPDNETYLNQLIDGTPNAAGTLFVDYNCVNGLKGRYSIVYGHNMNDGSMFGGLSRYEDPSFYEANKTMHVYIENQQYVYKVVGAFRTDILSYVYTDALNDIPVTEYIAKISSDNSYTMDNTGLTNDTNILVLSTCTNDSSDEERYVVILMRDHEVT